MRVKVNGKRVTEQNSCLSQSVLEMKSPASWVLHLVQNPALSRFG